MLAAWVFSGVVIPFLSFVGIDLRSPVYPAFVFPILQVIPRGIAFAYIGAITAPRGRTATAVLLVVLRSVLSLQVHILGHSNTRLTNYVHFIGASLGAVLGGVLI